MAKAVQELRSILSRKKEVMGRFKVDEEACNGNIDKLSCIITEEFDWREVPVEYERDYQRGVVVFYRKDTGEYESERPMTAREKQTELDLREDVADAKRREAYEALTQTPGYPDAFSEDEQEVSFLNALLETELDEIGNFTMADFIRAKDILTAPKAEAEPEE